MAAEKGLAMVLKVGDGASSESFTTVAGMRTTTIRINNELVDVTDKDSANARELLAAAGVQSMQIQCQGVFKDQASEATVRGNAEDMTIDNYQVVFADGDMYSGAWQISDLEYVGEYNGARQYSLTLESSGAITYA